MTRRTVILSDTHLGRPKMSAGRVEALRPLWRGARRLILNGDIAELQHPRFQAEAGWSVLRLQELCERDGVELLMLSGNHDPFLNELRFARLANGRVFVTHGDALHPAIAPWSSEARPMRRAFVQASAEPKPESRSELEHRLIAAQFAAQKECFRYERDHGQGALWEVLARPHAVFQILHYWKRVPELAHRFCERYCPDTRFFVFGHTHRHGLWRRGGRTLINTGCFGRPGKPRAVVIEDDQLELWPIVPDGSRWAFAQQPLRRFTLDAERDAKSVPSNDPSVAPA